VCTKPFQYANIDRSTRNLVVRQIVGEKNP
jgi:hypothetical protein